MVLRLNEVIEDTQLGYKVELHERLDHKVNIRGNTLNGRVINLDYDNVANRFTIRTVGTTVYAEDFDEEMEHAKKVYMLVKELNSMLGLK